MMRVKMKPPAMGMGLLISVMLALSRDSSVHVTNAAAVSPMMARLVGLAVIFVPAVETKEIGNTSGTTEADTEAKAGDTPSRIVESNSASANHPRGSPGAIFDVVTDPDDAHAIDRDDYGNDGIIEAIPVTVANAHFGSDDKDIDTDVLESFEDDFNSFLDEHPSKLPSHETIEALRARLIKAAQDRVKLKKQLMSQLEEEQRMTNEIETVLTKQIESAQKATATAAAFPPNYAKGKSSPTTDSTTAVSTTTSNENNNKNNNKKNNQMLEVETGASLEGGGDIQAKDVAVEEDSAYEDAHLGSGSPRVRGASTTPKLDMVNGRGISDARHRRLQNCVIEFTIPFLVSNIYAENNNGGDAVHGDGEEVVIREDETKEGTQLYYLKDVTYCRKSFETETNYTITGMSINSIEFKSKVQDHLDDKGYDHVFYHMHGLSEAPEFPVRKTYDLLDSFVSLQGPNRACRGDTSSDWSETYFYVPDNTPSFEQCREACEASIVGCYGINYNNENQRCEVWTRTPQATYGDQGYECFVRFNKEYLPIPILWRTSWRGNPLEKASTYEVDRNTYAPPMGKLLAKSDLFVGAPYKASIMCHSMGNYVFRNFAQTFVEGFPEKPELVSLKGPNQACRGDTSSDDSATYYDEKPNTPSFEQCREACEESTECYGIEYNDGNKRCEVWTRPPRATQSADGYECFVNKLNKFPEKPELVSLKGPDQACRGDFSSDDSATYYDEKPNTPSFEQCREECEASIVGCYGIEYNDGNKRCEVWTRPIQATAGNEGYECFVNKLNLPENPLFEAHFAVAADMRMDMFIEGFNPSAPKGSAVDPSTTENNRMLESRMLIPKEELKWNGGYHITLVAAHIHVTQNENDGALDLREFTQIGWGDDVRRALGRHGDEAYERTTLPYFKSRVTYHDFTDFVGRTWAAELSQEQQSPWDIVSEVIQHNYQWEPYTLRMYSACKEGPNTADCRLEGNSCGNLLLRGWPLDWHHEQTNVKKAWNYSLAEGKPAYGEGIVVAHIDIGYTEHTLLDDALQDSGFNLRGQDAEDFSQYGYQYNYRKGEDPWNVGIKGCGVECNYGGDKNYFNGVDSYGHGTLVAAHAVSRGGNPSKMWENITVTGVAPRAKSLPIRVSRSVILGGDVACNRMGDGIFEALRQKADVISISMACVGTFLKDRATQAVKDAYNANVIVVAASGNLGNLSPVVFPARSDYTVAVAGTEYDETFWPWAHAGSKVDIAAPSLDVCGPAAQALISDHKTRLTEGTSVATAQLGGIAALWLAHHGKDKLINEGGGCTLQDTFKRHLEGTARKGKDWEDRFGPGIVDAYKLLSTPFPTKRTNGAICSCDGECWSGRCKGNIPPKKCAPLGGDGDSCWNDGDCEEGLECRLVLVTLRCKPPRRQRELKKSHAHIIKSKGSKTPTTPESYTEKSKSHTESDMSLVDAITESNDYQVLQKVLDDATEEFWGLLNATGVTMFAPTDHAWCLFAELLLFQVPCKKGQFEPRQVYDYLREVINVAMYSYPPGTSYPDIVEKFILNHMTMDAMELTKEGEFKTLAKTGYNFKQGKEAMVIRYSAEGATKQNIALFSEYDKEGIRRLSNDATFVPISFPLLEPGMYNKPARVD